MGLIARTGNPKLYKHYRGPKKLKRTEIVIEDPRTVLERESAMGFQKYGQIERKWQDKILSAVEPGKQKIGIMRAIFERAYDKVNNKLNELFEQVVETDEKCRVLNVGFTEKVMESNKRFYDDVAAMSKENNKRNGGFMNKKTNQKFMSDLEILTAESKKRNFGYTKKKPFSDFDFMASVSAKRNDMFSNRKPKTQHQIMTSINETRMAGLLNKKPQVNVDRLSVMNNKRTALFIGKRPVTKFENVTRMHDQRNAMFRLR